MRLQIFLPVLQGKTFCDFPFSPADPSPSEKETTPQGKVIYSTRKEFAPSGVDHFSKGEQNHFERVGSLKGVQFRLIQVCGQDYAHLKSLELC